MSSISKEELDEVLRRHRSWLNDEDGGERANLSGANLSGTNLIDADLSGADLIDADLSGADLIDADLSGADLRDAVGNRINIKGLQIDRYIVTYTTDRMQIGCQNHDITEWWEFDDRRILEMDGKEALVWWRKWKLVLQQIIEMSPAEPTGYVDKEEDAA